MIGIIGGTGVYDIINDAENIETVTMDTPFGKSPEISIFELSGQKVAFIPRHSKDHDFPPHKINYRANIWALNKVGVERILATNAVGSMDEKIEPGSIVIPNDFLDFTKLRPTTFYDNETCHIDISNTYCPEIRSIISKNKNIVSGGVYVCTEGPRFETNSEIKMFKILGGTLVGMTGLPEVVLARELNMCYVSICLVSNYAASITKEKLTLDEVLDLMKKQKKDLINIIQKTIANISDEPNCNCQNTLDGSGKK